MNKLENALRLGASLRLCRYCHPKRCHGDVIAQDIRRKLQSKKAPIHGSITLGTLPYGIIDKCKAGN
eukprot:10392765-Karenia_brevis.AAC.1